MSCLLPVALMYSCVTSSSAAQLAILLSLRGSRPCPPTQPAGCRRSSPQPGRATPERQALKLLIFPLQREEILVNQANRSDSTISNSVWFVIGTHTDTRSMLPKAMKLFGWARLPQLMQTPPCFDPWFFDLLVKDQVRRRVWGKAKHSIAT